MTQDFTWLLTFVHSIADQYMLLTRIEFDQLVGKTRQMAEDADGTHGLDPLVTDALRWFLDLQVILSSNELDFDRLLDQPVEFIHLEARARYALCLLFIYCLRTQEMITGKTRSPLTHGAMAGIFQFLCDTLSWAANVNVIGEGCDIVPLYGSNSPSVLMLYDPVYLNTFMSYPGQSHNHTTITCSYDSFYNTFTHMSMLTRPLYRIAIQALSMVRSIEHLHVAEFVALKLIYDLPGTIAHEYITDDSNTVGFQRSPPVFSRNRNMGSRKLFRQHETMVMKAAGLFTAIGAIYGAAINRAFETLAKGDETGGKTDLSLILRDLAIILARSLYAAQGAYDSMTETVEVVLRWLKEQPNPGEETGTKPVPYVQDHEAVTYDAFFYVVSCLMIPVRDVCAYWSSDIGSFKYSYNELVLHSAELQAAISLLLHPTRSLEHVITSKADLIHFYDLFYRSLSYDFTQHVQERIRGGHDGSSSPAFKTNFHLVPLQPKIITKKPPFPLQMLCNTFFPSYADEDIIVLADDDTNVLHRPLDPEHLSKYTRQGNVLFVAEYIVHVLRAGLDPDGSYLVSLLQSAAQTDVEGLTGNCEAKMWIAIFRALYLLQYCISISLSLLTRVANKECVDVLQALHESTCQVHCCALSLITLERPTTPRILPPSIQKSFAAIHDSIAVRDNQAPIVQSVECGVYGTTTVVERICILVNLYCGTDPHAGFVLLDGLIDYCLLFEAQLPYVDCCLLLDAVLRVTPDVYKLYIVDRLMQLPALKVVALDVLACVVTDSHPPISMIVQHLFQLRDRSVRLYHFQPHDPCIKFLTHFQETEASDVEPSSIDELLLDEALLELERHEQYFINLLSTIEPDIIDHCVTALLPSYFSHQLVARISTGFRAVQNELGVVDLPAQQWIQIDEQALFGFRTDTKSDNLLILKALSRSLSGTTWITTAERIQEHLAGLPVFSGQYPLCVSSERATAEVITAILSAGWLGAYLTGAINMVPRDTHLLSILHTFLVFNDRVLPLERHVAGDYSTVVQTSTSKVTDRRGRQISLKFIRDFYSTTHLVVPFSYISCERYIRLRDALIQALNSFSSDAKLFREVEQMLTLTTSTESINVCLSHTADMLLSSTQRLDIQAEVRRDYCVCASMSMHILANSFRVLAIDVYSGAFLPKDVAEGLRLRPKSSDGTIWNEQLLYQYTTSFSRVDMPTLSNIVLLSGQNIKSLERPFDNTHKIMVTFLVHDLTLSEQDGLSLTPPENCPTPRELYMEAIVFYATCMIRKYYQNGQETDLPLRESLQIFTRLLANFIVLFFLHQSTSSSQTKDDTLGSGDKDLEAYDGDPLAILLNTLLLILHSFSKILVLSQELANCTSIWFVPMKNGTLNLFLYLLALFYRLHEAFRSELVREKQEHALLFVKLRHTLIETISGMVSSLIGNTAANIHTLSVLQGDIFRSNEDLVSNHGEMFAGTYAHTTDRSVMETLSSAQNAVASVLGVQGETGDETLMQNHRLHALSQIYQHSTRTGDISHGLVLSEGALCAASALCHRPLILTLQMLLSLYLDGTLPATTFESLMCYGMIPLKRADMPAFTKAICHTSGGIKLLTSLIRVSVTKLAQIEQPSRSPSVLAIPVALVYFASLSGDPILAALATDCLHLCFPTRSLLSKAHLAGFIDEALLLFQSLPPVTAANTSGSFVLWLRWAFVQAGGQLLPKIELTQYTAILVLQHFLAHANRAACIQRYEALTPAHSPNITLPPDYKTLSLPLLALYALERLATTPENAKVMLSHVTFERIRRLVQPDRIGVGLHSIFMGNTEVFIHETTEACFSTPAWGLCLLSCIGEANAERHRSYPLEFLIHNYANIWVIEERLLPKSREASQSDIAPEPSTPSRTSDMRLLPLFQEYYRIQSELVVLGLVTLHLGIWVESVGKDVFTSPEAGIISTLHSSRESRQGARMGVSSILSSLSEYFQLSEWRQNADLYLSDSLIQALRLNESALGEFIEALLARTGQAAIVAPSELAFRRLFYGEKCVDTMRTTQVGTSCFVSLNPSYQLTRSDSTDSPTTYRSLISQFAWENPALLHFVTLITTALQQQAPSPPLCPSFRLLLPRLLAYAFSCTPSYNVHRSVCGAITALSEAATSFSVIVNDVRSLLQCFSKYLDAPDMQEEIGTTICNLAASWPADNVGLLVHDILASLPPEAFSVPEAVLIAGALLLSMRSFKKAITILERLPEWRTNDNPVRFVIHRAQGTDVCSVVTYILSGLKDLETS
ncbi:hypothetical protein GMRT_12937 [Giardia muris]|uniref:Uncharacterized protein n=1 Tax=Giardia muris TaxID=5742 RepID=A0A4Z1T7G4_GIAMU|nr:hypothetical protein GMRT_12937 [Giardia muris]|eukprot:TNJ29087.1 hypothetical protein GMRT_12937 [Giardia muris]